MGFTWQAESEVIRQNIMVMVQNNQFDDLVPVIDNIVKQKDNKFCSLLIEYLLDTNNQRIRNLFAIALSDLGCQDSVRVIISLLKSEKTIGNRGTLLYALEQLEYAGFIEEIVAFLDDNSFEVRLQALSLLEKASLKLTSRVKKKCRDTILLMIENYNEKLDVLDEAISLFGKGKK